MIRPHWLRDLVCLILGTVAVAYLVVVVLVVLAVCAALLAVIAGGEAARRWGVVHEGEAPRLLVLQSPRRRLGDTILWR